MDDPIRAYKEKFGEEPALMGIGDSFENIVANIWNAIAEDRPLWTFYYDIDPSKSDIDI